MFMSVMVVWIWYPVKMKMKMNVSDFSVTTNCQLSVYECCLGARLGSM